MRLKIIFLAIAIGVVDFLMPIFLGIPYSPYVLAAAVILLFVGIAMRPKPKLA